MYQKAISIIYKYLNNKNIINSIWIIGQQIVQMVLQLIIGIFVARYLGPGNYGSLNYTASFVAFFMSFATLGMDGVIIKKLIDQPQNEGVYLGSAMLMRLLSSVTSILCVSVVVYLLNPDEPIKVLLVFLQSLQLLFKAIQILDSWFQRHLKSKYVSLGKMIAYILISCYKIYLLMETKGVLWFALSNTLSDLIIVLFEIYYYKKDFGQKLDFDITVCKSIIKESYHFIISGMMVALYSQMDKVMIGQMMTNSDVGYYATAVSICSMWIFIPNAIISSFQPLIMELKKKGDEDLYLLRLKQLYSAIVWLCIFVSLVISIISKPAIEILFGVEYLPSVDIIKIVIWYVTFAMIGTARGIWILCENKNKYVKYYLAIGSVVNFVMNLIMIPSFGVNGAAFATLLTQIVNSLIAPLFYKETRVHTLLVIDAFFFRWRFKR